jgi:tetratricopeptide (TPR) repeat protein
LNDGRGRNLLKIFMPVDRIERLKGFLLKDPNDAFVKHALALEYSKTGDDATARRLLEEVLEADGTAVGSYYQLGKLLERTGETALALAWYQRGMNAAKTAGEQRALNELRSAYEDLAEE